MKLLCRKKRDLMLRLLREQQHCCAYCGFAIAYVADVQMSTLWWCSDHFRISYLDALDGLWKTRRIATFDHVVPRSKGGRSHFTNYVVACFHCNIRKGRKTLTQRLKRHLWRRSRIDEHRWLKRSVRNG